jgi:hypothetical protein
MFKTVQLQVRLQLPLFGVVCWFEPVYQDFRKLAYQSLSHPEPAVIMHGTGWMVHDKRQERLRAGSKEKDRRNQSGRPARILVVYIYIRDYNGRQIGLHCQTLVPTGGGGLTVRSAPDQLDQTALRPQTLRSSRLCPNVQRHF